MQLTKSNIHYWVSIFLTVLLPAYQILKGYNSLFYILYIFWWHELLTTSVNLVHYIFQNKLNHSLQLKMFFSRYFLLMIYFVFIVVVFGFLPSIGNKALMKMNFSTFLFQDLVFNTSLVSIFINECWYRYYSTENTLKVYESPFSGRMTVMHISIILGALIFSLYKHIVNESFTSTYQWQALLAAIPFLLLKMYVLNQENKESSEYPS